MGCAFSNSKKVTDATVAYTQEARRSSAGWLGRLSVTPAPDKVVAYVPTAEQAAAAAVAEKRQSLVAQAADEVSEETKAKVGGHWVDRCGGLAIEDMLEHMWLIDAQYCIALAEEGGILPRYQAIPESAWLGPHNKWRLRCWNQEWAAPVLVLSYPWLDRMHPARRGEQLCKVLPILKAMVEKAQTFGAHCTIGVLWDYACLPQRPYGNERECERFKVG